MTLVEVKSSNIKKVGYEGTSLFVEFANGLYEYENVPADLYNQLLEADSKGRFVGANIIGKYSYKKLTK